MDKGDETMNLEMIHAAAIRLVGNARRTPLLHSPFLDDVAGRRVLVKAECLQHTGSFKYRGAFASISALPDDVREKGILAFSSGNHAQGIALAAKQHNAPAVIVMPSDAPEIKLAKTRAYGAEVVLYDRGKESRENIAAFLATERGLRIIKPYDEPQVIAGQGTTGLEIAQQSRDLDVGAAEVLVCCGGGGLSSGIAVALSKHAPDMTVRTVEPEGFDDTARSLAAGTRVSNDTETGSICDAIVTPTPGEITFPILQQHCGAGLVVSEDEVLRAMAMAFERLKIVIEPGGAVALAAALFHGDSIASDTVIAVASGGNVEAEMFARALQTKD